VLAAIAGVLTKISAWPLIGKATDERDVRVVIVPRYLYRIFYLVDGQTVFIIRVLHRAQDRP
jgi:toxin ParE1/3/4